MSRRPANRSELLRLRQSLARVERGAGLLRRKRESLVAELLRQARPAVLARRAIDSAAHEAYQALRHAGAELGPVDLQGFSWPERRLEVELATARLWGQAVAQIATAPTVARSLEVRGAFPGAAAPAVRAARRFEALVDLLLAAASEEQRLRRLARAAQDATRRMNGLERRVGVRLRLEGRAVAQALDEREREEKFRLARLLERRAGGAH